MDRVEVRSVMLLVEMLLRVWLVPRVRVDLLWHVPIGLEFLGRKNVMLSERGSYWSRSFHLGSDGSWCWDSVCWRLGVDDSLGFGLDGGIVTGVVFRVVGEGGAGAGERSFGHVGSFVRNSADAGRGWGSGEGDWGGEVGAVDNSLLQLSNGDPLLWVSLKNPAKDVVQVIRQRQDGLQKLRILGEGLVCGILNGRLLPWVTATGEIDQNHAKGPDVVGCASV